MNGPYEWINGTMEHIWLQIFEFESAEYIFWIFLLIVFISVKILKRVTDN